MQAAAEAVMDCQCEFTDAFFQLAGPRWKLAKAIAIHESSLNPHAVGDGGDAQGLWQMHAAFAVDHTPLLSYPVAVWVLLRGVPFVSVRIMAAFLAKMGASVSDGDVIGAFHYGVAGWNSCASKAIDQYVKAVLAILAAL